MTTHFIHSLLNDIIDNILDKWLNIVGGYLRLVMRNAYWCSICDKNYINEQITTIYVNSPRSGYIYGWTHCNKCNIFNTLIEKYYYIHYCNFIQSKLCKPYRKLNFNFYRKPSNLNIKPYIQKKAIYKYLDYDFLTLDKKTNHVYAQITWTINSISWTKLINLSNLIFYNRDIFGYSIDDFKIKHISNQFKRGIIQQYNHTNEWYMLHCIFNRKSITNIHIPDLIQNKIFLFWNNLYIFKIKFN